MTGGVQDYGIIALIMGLCMGLVEVIKKMIPRISAAQAGYTAQDRERDNHLAAQHKRYDEDGTELWYVPRSMGQTLDKMLDELREINKRLS